MSQVISGIRWNTLNTIIGHGANLARFLLIAAATGPAVAGQYAIAVAIVGGAAVLTEVGFRQQFIATPLGTDEQTARHRLSVAWHLNLCLRLIIVGLVFFLIGSNKFVALAAGETLFAALILAVSGLIAAASNPELLERERRGDFRLITICESGGQLFGLALAISLVSTHGSLKLLVFSQLAASGAQAVGSYLFAPQRPLERTTVLDLKKMARAGLPFMAIAVTTYATYSLDKLIIGWALDPTAVGLYYTAQRLAEVPAFAFSAIVSRTVLPTYLRIGSARAHLLARAVRRFTVVLFSIFVPTYALIIILLNLEGVLAYFSNWTEARGLLLLLIIASIFRVGCHITSPAMIIRGDVAKDAAFKVQEAVVYVPLLVLVVWQFGATGAAACAVALYAFSWWRRYRFVGLYESTLPSFSSR